MSQPSLQIRRLDARKQEITEELNQLRERLSPRGEIVSEAGLKRTIDVFGQPLSPAQVADQICEDVRLTGFSAVRDYTRSIDKVEITEQTLRVPEETIAAAHHDADASFLASVRRIRDQILQFQQALLHKDVEVRREGVVLRQRYLPLDRVGLCIPGGAAAYPSTVLMTAGCAIAAGVPEIAVVAPPTPFGADNADVLAVCHELGIREVYRVGGVQAVAALAYGVVGLPRVDKIAGPGNLFVALAKKRVYGEVDIDSFAGPSEVVVIADESSRPDFTAADMLAQAEHAPGSSILVTWSESMLDQTAAELERQVIGLSRSNVTVESLEQFGALILTNDEDQACEIANQLATEHLHIATENAQRMLPKIRHAGAVFLGVHTPVALGDYAAGPSHVLPTGGSARFSSGLTANDFLRGGSVIAYSPEALRKDADDVRMMADKEGLTAHRASVEIRLAGR